MIVSDIMAQTGVDCDPNRAQHALSAIDQILSYGALALVVGAGAWWAVRRRRDPLANAPERPNQLREDALMLTILVYLTTAVAISGIVQLAAGHTESVLATMFVGSGAQLAGLGACLVVAATRFEGGVRRFCLGDEGARSVSWIAITLVLTIAAIGLCPVIRDAAINITLYFAPDHEFTPHPTIKALQERTQPIGIVVMLWTGAIVIAPVAEEFFFRGLLQTFLIRLVRNRWLAIGLASLAFGAVHLSQPHAVGALAVLGLLIGYAYERTGSLLPPIAIHAAFNFKTLIWDALGGFPT
ncbi:MAG: CPBP family intramembrane glutamic endopeptidase [Phycisphaerae bacterium]